MNKHSNLRGKGGLQPQPPPPLRFYDCKSIYSNRAVNYSNNSHSIQKSSVANYEVVNKDSYVLYQ